jgi:hypothetical protein
MSNSFLHKNLLYKAKIQGEQWNLAKWEAKLKKIFIVLTKLRTHFNTQYKYTLKHSRYGCMYACRVCVCVKYYFNFFTSLFLNLIEWRCCDNTKIFNKNSIFNNCAQNRYKIKCTKKKKTFKPISLDKQEQVHTMQYKYIYIRITYS